MKSDLTCPVEVVSVRIERDDEHTNDNGRIACLIEFFNLSQKVIDSLQLNIVGYDESGERLGGRFVRAAAKGEARARFTGMFMPDHLEGAVRLDAQIEKVWFQDGVVWRREERNEREYTPNTLPPGRELDRLRAVAGPDAQGYAREDDIVWMCVCGRANPTSEDTCRRCERERAHVLKAYSFTAIDATVGRKERMLEQQTKDTLRRSSEQTVKEQDEADRKRRRRRRLMTAVIVLLILLVIGLATLRWGLPYGAHYYAGYEAEQGKLAEAKARYEWVETYWPGMTDAAEQALTLEEQMIRELIDSGEDEKMEQAANRAMELISENAGALYVDAMMARAELAIENKEYDKAEELLTMLPGEEAAVQLHRELVYTIASEAMAAEDYETAIERFDSLGEYEDAAAQKEECIYLHGKALMADGQYEQAAEQLMLVSGRTGVIALIRQCRYALALEKQEAGALEEAAELFESLGIYEEAETRGKACRYEIGMDLLGEGELAAAAEQLKLAEDYEDAKERFADAAMTLGSRALESEDWQEAIRWLGELESSEENDELLNTARYGYAQQLEDDGRLEQAAAEFAKMGDYEDARERALKIEYALAERALDVSLEDALVRFEALGDYEDAPERVTDCRYRLANELYAAGDYARALSSYETLDDHADSREQARRCRYALGKQAMEAQDYEDAQAYFEACGAYLDAEELAMQARYALAQAAYDAGEYERAAQLFGALGSYQDAKARVTASEDAWLGEGYTGAQMDMEVGNYEGVIAALEEVTDAELPERYADIPELYEQACLARAQELIAMDRPLDALPFLRRIEGNKTASNLMDAYVYRIIGRWKDARGTQYVFREDGTCTIADRNAYFGGRNYEIFVGDAPYPTSGGYVVVSIKKNTATLREAGTESTVRLTYLGEPTPIEAQADDAEAAEDTDAQDGEKTPGEDAAEADGQEQTE